MSVHSLVATIGKLASTARSSFAAVMICKLLLGSTLIILASKYRDPPSFFLTGTVSVLIALILLLTACLVGLASRERGNGEPRRRSERRAQKPKQKSRTKKRNSKAC